MTSWWIVKEYKLRCTCNKFVRDYECLVATEELYITLHSWDIIMVAGFYCG